jgi:Protein of unknown function (DUF2630)
MPLDPRDDSVLDHIKQLVEEEKELYKSSDNSQEARARLSQLKVQLDQCWDLLRQRDALREFGKDPKEAQVRSADVVENYEQ